MIAIIITNLVITFMIIMVEGILQSKLPIIPILHCISYRWWFFLERMVYKWNIMLIYIVTIKNELFSVISIWHPSLSSALHMRVLTNQIAIRIRSTHGGGAEWGVRGERENFKQTPHSTQSPVWGWIPQLWDYDLSRNHSMDWATKGTHRLLVND